VRIPPLRRNLQHSAAERRGFFREPLETPVEFPEVFFIMIYASIFLSLKRDVLSKDQDLKKRLGMQRENLSVESFSREKKCVLQE
jgi:hypothetical protein